MLPPSSIRWRLTRSLSLSFTANHVAPSSHIPRMSSFTSRPKAAFLSSPVSAVTATHGGSGAHFGGERAPNTSLQRTRRQSLRSFLFAAELDIVGRRKSRIVRGTVMTALLEKALAEISKLPPPQQEEVASWLLAELEDEARWAESFSRSSSTLERLADAALAEHRSGNTQGLDLKPR